MIDRQDELERFKTDIALTEYAAWWGYVDDPRDSTENSRAMKKGTDKVIITRAVHDGHWIYFSVRDDSDNGSIIDFAQRRHGGTLGDVRKLLRPWIGIGSLPASRPRPKPESYVRTVTPVEKDRQKVVEDFGRMIEATRHPYLESRAVGEKVLGHPRFAGRIRADSFGNAVFPLFDGAGLCNFERKNRGILLQSKDGVKGIWKSHQEPDDECLVICESVIDALSYHALNDLPQTRYVATAGGWGSKGQELLLREAERHPGRVIVLAFDRDEAGERFVQEAMKLFDGLEKVIEVDLPPGPEKDWNDHLQLLAKATDARNR